MIEIMIPFIAYWFAKITGLPQRFTIINRKPFNCPKCFAFWLALAYQIKKGFTLESIVIICISSLMAWVIERFVISLKIITN